jgi:hypothetical protein
MAATLLTPVRIRYGTAGTLDFHGGRWQTVVPELEPLAAMATLLSGPAFYEYSPADGLYGARLAGQIVARLGGVVELPPLPEGAPEPVDVIA